MEMVKITSKGSTVFGVCIAVFSVAALVLPSFIQAAPLNFDADQAITLSSPAVSLTVLSGSKADALQVNPANVVATLSSTTGGNFVISLDSLDLSVSASGGGGSSSKTCVAGLVTVTISQATGSADYTITPTDSVCVSGHAPGSGGSYTPPAASISWKSPSAAATYAPGQTVGLEWLPANGAFVKYSLYYSPDDGGSWNTISSNLTTAWASWTVPDLAITQGRFKVEGYDATGTLLASAVSAGTFTVTGTNAPALPPAEDTTVNPPPLTDATATGAYSASAAQTNTPDINTDKGLAAPPAGTAVYCAAGSLIKGALPAVYYCGADGKRYVFGNEKVYLSWYPDFSTVQTIPDQTLAQVTLGGNITYRPGAKLVKIQTDPKVYAVARGGVLRWVTTEAIAARLYGTNWNRMIDDIPDSFFVNYTVGAPISE